MAMPASASTRSVRRSKLAGSPAISSRPPPAAIFAELLGGPSRGFLEIRPVDPSGAPAQKYLVDSFVLETRWPGLLVTERTMAALHAEGVRRFDLSIGNQDYQRRFGAGERLAYCWQRHNCAQAPQHGSGRIGRSVLALHF